MPKGEVTLTENKNRAKKGTMPNNALDLSDITLPEDDKNKPAELPLAPDDQKTELEEKNGSQPVEKKEDVIEDKKETTEAPGKPEEAKPGEPEKKEEVKVEDKKPDQKPPEEKELTPFHEHPDWKKMQKENQELRDQLNQLKGKVEVTTAEKTDDDPYAALPPRKAAIARVRQEILDKKFNPKDQLELEERVLDLQDEYTEKQKTQEKKKLEEVKTKIEKQIDDTMVEMGVTDPGQQEKIIGLVNKWRSEGMAGISVQTLKVAKLYLEKTGELNAPITPSEKKEDLKPEEKKEEAKKPDANSKIVRKSGGGTPPTKSQFTLKNGVNKSLDQLTTELGAQLDKSPQG